MCFKKTKILNNFMLKKAWAGGCPVSSIWTDRTRSEGISSECFRERIQMALKYIQKVSKNEIQQPNNNKNVLNKRLKTSENEKITLRKNMRWSRGPCKLHLDWQNRFDNAKGKFYEHSIAAVWKKVHFLTTITMKM